jgi:hypothetical protein
MNDEEPSIDDEPSLALWKFNMAVFRQVFKHYIELLDLLLSSDKADEATEIGLRQAQEMADLDDAFMLMNPQVVELLGSMGRDDLL